MPAPQASMMQNLAKTQFRSFGIKIPTDWTGEESPKHTELEQGNPADLSASAMWLFKPASTIKLHVEAAKSKSREFESYIDGICSAICSAWSTWQSAAALVGVMINGPVAALGNVVGPPWTPLILAQGPNGKPQETKYTKTIATVIGTAWQQYTLTIKVPAMPWYPAFLMFPLAVAPPMPNIPCPVAALTQAAPLVGKSALKSQMIAQHGDPQAQHHRELFDCIADAFEKCHQVWQTSTQVTNVLGFGPVPSWTPVSPAGPVVAGFGAMMPGGFV